MFTVGGTNTVLCNSCLQWEERCGVLELEIQRKNIDFELLQGRIGALNSEKLELEDKVRVLQEKNDQLEERIIQIENAKKIFNDQVKETEKIVDLTGEGEEGEDKVFQLMIENKVLECEKKNAESQVDIWKAKFKELEDKLLISGKESVLTAMPIIHTPCMLSQGVEGGKIDMPSGPEVKDRKRIRKQLEFREDESPKKKIAPSTPAVAVPAFSGVIDLTDSDGERYSTPNIETRENKIKFTMENNLNEKSVLDQSDEEDRGYKGIFPCLSVPRRKRASNIVTTDSESSDDDDDLPISKLMTRCLPESNTESHLNNISPSTTASRRRIVTLGKLEVKNDPEISSDSEGESLGGFIVDDSTHSSSGVSESDDDDDSLGKSENSVDENMDYKEVISRIRRNKVDNSKWEFEADMLAAFGKDPELCMKAVCAIYRQQTSDEKSSKGTIYANQRGFSHCDAYRGSALAEFLTGGDPQGDLVKNVDELREYSSKGIELCRNLATHYSKQLFAIYKNKEDPFFLPP